MPLMICAHFSNAPVSDRKCLAPNAQHSTPAWGSTPGSRGSRRRALKARFISGTRLDSIRLIEARFQRLLALRFESLGRCPRLA